ncbi:unnamed protein product, partial [Heterotrigona itama]
LQHFCDHIGKGHTLITNNWYSSPLLYTLLHKYKTNAYGTIRKNRIGMPDEKKKIKPREFEYQFSNNLLALRWFDK